MKKKLSMGLVSLTFAMGNSVASWANSIDDKALGNIVVSATKTARNIEDVPASVTVINREQIERSAAKTVDELLVGVAGVYSARMDVSAPNRIAQTYTRGMSGSGRMLVLVDGIAMNVQFDGQVDWSQLSVNDVERVEVVRGAGSSLYGGSAMSGIVNIISRKIEPGLVKEASIGYGSNNTVSASAAIRGGGERTGLSLSVNRLTSDGYDMWPQANKTAAGVYRDKLIEMGTEKTTLTGRLTHDLSDNQALNFGLSYLNDVSTKFYDVPRYTPTERSQWLLSGGYKYFGEQSETSLMVYGRFGDQKADSTRVPYTAVTEKTDFDDRTLGANLQTTWFLGRHDVTLGLDYMDGSIDVNRQRLTNQTNQQRAGWLKQAAIFVQDEIRVTDDFNVNLLGRFDRWQTSGRQTDTQVGLPSPGRYGERDGTVFSPKLAALYKLNTDVHLRGSVGKAFKMPQLQEMYSSNRQGTATYWGNPNLEPETVIGYELGLDYYFAPGSYIKTTIFRNNAENFIYNVRRDLTNFDKMNLAQVEIEGVEVEARYSVTSRLNLLASYTYNHSYILKSQLAPTIEGKSLTTVPDHQWFVKAELDLAKQIQTYVSANFVGNRFGNDANTSVYQYYYVYDLGVSKAFNSWLSGRFDIHNIANTVYQGNSYMSPGRVVSASMKAVF